jgi:hypothetical protein
LFSEVPGIVLAAVEPQQSVSDLQISVSGLQPEAFWQTFWLFRPPVGPHAREQQLFWQAMLPGGQFVPATSQPPTPVAVFSPQ